MKQESPFCGHSWFVRVLAALVFLSVGARASDHADPMSLNVFEVLKTREANITDLHAFIVDGAHQPITDPERLKNFKEDDQLIISLCVRRALTPAQIGGLDFKGYTFRLHIDYDAPVRIVGRDGDVPDTDIARRSADDSAQALYGGIITDPTAIMEDAVLDFQLEREDPEDETATVAITHVSVQGIEGKVNRLPFNEKDEPGKSVDANSFNAGEINCLAGVFDDPFIFPRFFRRNVVGIVTSIPLKSLVKGGKRIPLKTLATDGRKKETQAADGTKVVEPLILDKPLVIWATTHKGKEQIDHVGRSLRTQLPRFGYLNDKHPSQQVEAIIKVHDKPNLMESLGSTFISPLLAHRHYDTTPDVMIYDLRQPAVFPNGRRLEDDVAQTLATAGETLLLELSYSESRQFPRATKNDKPFRGKFPFLAPRWTEQQVKDHRPLGTKLGDFDVPFAADADAIATPDFGSSVWRSVWKGLVLGILLMTLLCFIFAHRNWLRLLLVILVAIVLWQLYGLLEMKAAPMDMNYFTQPAYKVMLALIGGGFILALMLLLVWLLGRRSGVRSAVVRPASPIGKQEEVGADREYNGSTFKEVRDAVFKNPYQTVPWGAQGAQKFPIYEVTFRSVAKGLFSKLSRKYFPFGEASNRTIKSFADLRWGEDGRGVKRLLHPNGMVLTGRWIINADAPAGYTGGFKPGTECLIIGRYSTCCTEVRSGKRRSLSLVAKLFPTRDPEDPKKYYTKTFITQDDIGGRLTHSIFDGNTFNAPDVTPHRRGFSGILPFIVTVITLMKTDREPSIRQLYEIAELGEEQKAIDDGTFKINCPQFMRLRPMPPPGASDPEPGTDFRDEVMNLLYNPGDPNPKKAASGESVKFVFEIDIDTTEKGSVTGKLVKRLNVKNWTTIGRIEFDDAVVSYNGDHVIHFHHPAWRNDRNDPKSVSGPANSFLVRLLKKILP